jgi:hypothetical protein
MMDFPFVGDTVGGFTVERVEVTDEIGDSGLHAYSVRMTLRGLGGKQGVRGALKAVFAAHPTVFSAYGNPYLLWLSRPEIEGLGDRRYAVRIEGAGARVYLKDELRRFLSYLEETGQLAAPADQAACESLIESYLEDYHSETRRKVDRYKRKLRKEV